MDRLAFAQALTDGVRYATFDYWGLLLLFAAGVWSAKATVDVQLRRWLFVLPGLWAVSLLSTASIQVVPMQYLRLCMVLPLAALLLGLGAYLALLAHRGGRRAPRLLWGAVNLTFVCRAALHLGHYA